MGEFLHTMQLLHIKQYIKVEVYFSWNIAVPQNKITK